MSSLGKGVASQDAIGRFQSSFARAMFLDDLFGILGASGVEFATVPHERTDSRLIHIDEKNKYTFHKQRIIYSELTKTVNLSGVKGSRLNDRKLVHIAKY